MEQKSFLGPQYEVTIKKPKKKPSKPQRVAHFTKSIQQCNLTSEACVFADGLWCLKEDNLQRQQKKCNFNK